MLMTLAIPVWPLPTTTPSRLLLKMVRIGSSLWTRTRLSHPSIWYKWQAPGANLRVTLLSAQLSLKLRRAPSTFHLITFFLEQRRVGSDRDSAAFPCGWYLRLTPVQWCEQKCSNKSEVTTRDFLSITATRQCFDFCTSTVSVSTWTAAFSCSMSFQWPI